MEAYELSIIFSTPGCRHDQGFCQKLITPNPLDTNVQCVYIVKTKCQTLINKDMLYML